jgi:hypothetical protein
MKNAVFWDIITQFLPHKKNITSLLQSTADECYVSFEVFTVLTMKNAVFWDVNQRGLRCLKNSEHSQFGCGMSESTLTESSEFLEF